MKTVKVDESDWDKLQRQKLNSKLDRIADVIKDNIKFAERFSNEKEFRNWFKNHYTLLGFNKIIKSNITSTPDFIMERDGSQIKVELETLSSHFFVHKHSHKDIDVVICLVQDKTLPVRTIEIGKFEYINPTQFVKTVKIEQWLHDYLDKQGQRGETFTQIIARLIATKRLNEQQTKELDHMKKQYEGSL